MYKIPVYFFGVGFGTLNFDGSVVEPSPYPYLICILGRSEFVLTQNEDEIFTTKSNNFYILDYENLLPIVRPLTVEINLHLNPNIEKYPQEFFRPAGQEIDIL